LSRRGWCLAAVLAFSVGAQTATPPPARAISPLKAGCTVAGAIHPTARKVCTGIQLGLRAFSAIKALFGGHLGSAFKSLLGQGSSPQTPAATTAASAAVGLAAIGTWVLGGAAFALHETATVLGHTTSPQLESSWFSATYWRVAGIAAVLTLPFLFAAAVQALVRSDLTLLLRAALGYLPLAMLAVAVAAPLTMLLLAASDQMAGAVSSAAGNASAHFLAITGAALAAAALVHHSPFIIFLVGLLTVAGAVTLWVELLIREAAVYVIVLMLPLVFSALVWPARRIWAVRAVELLVALVLSKFAIVAVLSLGGAAISHSFTHSVSGMLTGVVLLGLGVFAPWALLRLIPLAELASSAASSLRSQGRAPVSEFDRGWAVGDEGERWASTTAAMRRDSERGLSVESGAPRTSATDGTAERANGNAASSQAAGDPTEDDAPLPEPQEPELAGERPERSAPVGAPQPVGATRPAERIPDLPPMWQQDDRSWEPVILGLEGIPGAPQQPRHDQPGEHQGGLPGSRTEAGESAPGDDHDPTPPAQPPPDGRL
jgi:hypothetical protein